MRFQSLCLSSLSVASAACSTVPMEVTHPEPVQIVLRVTSTPSCGPGAECPREPGTLRYRGPLVFAEDDSLVMTDMTLGRRVTVRSGPGTRLEVYRGQKRTVGAVATGAGKGFLAGIAAGAAEGFIAGGLSRLVGVDVDVGDMVKSGVVIGGSTGALAGGAQGLAEGDAVWETVTLLQLRQQICKCADPDRGRRPEPTPWPKGPIP